MEPTFNPADFLNYLAQELVDNFARAGTATTPGLVGSAREEEVRKKLEALLPEKVSVASGCVIDSHGSTSRQTDVIIHERDNCPVFSINGHREATYIPCEGTVAVGEIKSTLNTKELEDCIVKLRKIKELRRAVRDPTCFRHYGTALVMQGAPQEAYDPVNKAQDQIFGFVLCQKFGISQETLAKNYTALCSDAAPHLVPNMVLSLADGFMMFADERGTLLRNAVGAKRIAFFTHPAGNFQYLLSWIVNGCHNGRTTDLLPHFLYLLGAHRDAKLHPTYISMT
jgi:hypothetical protein